MGMTAWQQNKHMVKAHHLHGLVGKAYGMALTLLPRWVLVEKHGGLMGKL